MRTSTASEMLGALGYTKAVRLEDAIDIYTFVDSGGYSLTVDGRMMAIWRLPSIPGDGLTEDQRTGIANELARLIDLYPEGSSGQYVRFSHRDVRDKLTRYREGIRQEGFLPVIGKSVLAVQERAARFGFFANAKQGAELLDRVKKMELEGDDGSEVGTPDPLPNPGITRGTVAMVVEHYLVFAMDSSLRERRGFSQASQALRSLFGLSDGEAFINRMEADEHRFLEAVSELEFGMEAIGLAAERQNASGICKLLYRILNPRRCLIAAPPEPTRFETLADALSLTGVRTSIGSAATGTTLKTSPESWSLDGYHHYATSVRVMPEETRAAMLLDPIQKTEGEGWCTVNWWVPAQGLYRMNLRIKAQMLSNQKELSKYPIIAPDPMKLEKRDQDLAFVGNAINPEEREYHKVVRTSVHIVARDSNAGRAKRRAKQLEKLLWNSGYLEQLRGDAVIHHSLPGNFRQEASQFIGRDLPVLSTNLADLLPIYTGFNGLDDGKLMFNNSVGEPIGYDLFTRHATAGHTLISGGTGTGKSFLANGLISQSRVQAPTKTFVIDKGFNFDSHTRATEGQLIVLVPEPMDGYEPPCLNPFWIDDSKGHRQPSSLELSYMLSVLNAMLKSGTTDESGRTEPVRKEEMNILMGHLTGLFAARQPGGELIMTHLMNSLRANPADSISNELARRLVDFSSEGMWGRLFDGPLSVNWDAEMVCVETSLMADSPAMDVVMLILFMQIESYVKFKLPRGVRKLLFIDESWKVLAKPHLARIVGSFFRELRKYQGAVVLLSQGLADFRALVNAEGGADDGIMMNTRHFIMLGASKQDMDDAEAMFAITPEDRAMWGRSRSAIPQFTEFFYLLRHRSNINVTALMRYCSDPATYWLSTTEPAEVDLRKAQFQKRSDESASDGTANVMGAVIAQLAEEYPYGLKSGG
ncbi:hypothetical protein JN531_017020 (plasmid) [Flagellatimonas centrodinii]|uniref:VirB4 family type IV secretion system protein n=1 Tax=Flagellatimonas centrodinii TaxID=2806210 RepID=UPI001FEE7728|nr:hypothetical protein [Flagellatimonas centrodinii]ULQ48335.1 hypothetical protein JN531_017020 [Flagellatimonas centrodinii]